MSTTFETATLVVAAGETSEDQIAVFDAGDDLILVVADGAGGSGGGAEAAQAVVDAVREQIPAGLIDRSLLMSCEKKTGGGETTAILLRVAKDGISGVAVGDSGAWLFEKSACRVLTTGVPTKPLLGSGQARPTSFRAGPLTDASMLLLATDGLLKYASEARIAETLRQSDFKHAPEALVELVRLPSGELQDDVGIVLCRRRPVRR